MKPAEISEKRIASLLPERPVRSNKATFGKVLCLAGSYCMSGAAYLCAKAAYRSGTGMVRVFTPEENRIIIQTSLPEALVSVYDSNSPDTSELIEGIKWADVVVAGPGIGWSEGALALLTALLRNTVKPLVLDADGINALEEHIDTLACRRQLPTVLTPHAGEFARVGGDGAMPRKEAAKKFAVEQGVVLVLKGPANCGLFGVRAVECGCCFSVLLYRIIGHAITAVRTEDILISHLVSTICAILY